MTKLSKCRKVNNLSIIVHLRTTIVSKAGVPQLVSILLKEFILLVGLSIVIAAPLAGWSIHEWLQNSLIVLPCRGGCLWPGGVAATANPVKSLSVE